jgi:hypothetical protein
MARISAQIFYMRRKSSCFNLIKGGLFLGYLFLLVGNSKVLRGSSPV